jgi:hypothetical protein
MKRGILAVLMALVVLPAQACYELHNGTVLLSRTASPPFDISYDETGPSAAIRASQARGEHLVMSPRPCDDHNVEQARYASYGPPLGGRGASVGAGYGNSVRDTAGTDVQVRAYTRKDGTYVPAHTRAAPGRGKNRK